MTAVDIGFTRCDLHFPHKEWASPEERANYLAIERWALQFRKDCVRREADMATVQFTGCDLHIPHKEWSGDERERQNYLEMERWALHFRKNCIPPCPETLIPVDAAYMHGTASASPTNSNVTCLPRIGATPWSTVDFCSLTLVHARRDDGAPPAPIVYSVSVGPDPGYTHLATLTFTSGSDDVTATHRVEVWGATVPAGTLSTVAFSSGDTSTNATKVMQQNVNFNAAVPLHRLNLGLAEVYSNAAIPTSFPLTYGASGGVHVAMCIMYASNQTTLPLPYPDGPLGVGDAYDSVSQGWGGSPAAVIYGRGAFRRNNPTLATDSYSVPAIADTSALWKAVALTAVYGP